MYKVFVLVALVAVAYAQHYGYESGFDHDGSFEHGSHDDEHDGPSHYSFEYSVHDSKTGDYKQAKESREGDVVKGFYTLKEADGSTREVHYTADKHNGFSAQVVRSGQGYHSQQLGGHGHDFY